MGTSFVSIAEQLSDVLRTEIEEGRFGPGHRIDPERRLAQRWGVARLTVTKALDALVKEGLLERRPGRGTFVKPGVEEKEAPPRGVATIRRLGLCFLDLYEATHPYFAKLTKSLAQHCAEEGQEFSLFTIQPGDLYYRRSNPLSQGLRTGIVDGLLVAGRMRIEDILALKRSGIPFVWINHEISGEDIPAVLVDYAWGAFRAVRHLIGIGHKRIGLILGTRHNRATSGSRTGYELAFEAAGLDVREALVTRGRFDSETGYRGALSLLRGDDPPTAIFAVDDIIATGVLRAAHELGRSVPGDLSVVGYGNFFESCDTQVGLTTLDTHLDQVARAAAKLLGQVAERKRGDVVIKPDLVVRESTAPPGGVKR